MNGFLTAVGFLTIIPVGKRVIEEEDLGRSMVFFPLIGLMIGGLLVGVDLLGRQIFSPLVVSLLVIGVWAIISGALHLDGFCDTIDGLCGGSNREETLRIMAQPGIGAKGMVAVICLLLIKTFSLLEAKSPYPLLIVPTMGRWAMVAGAVMNSYARPTGLGKAFVDYMGKRESLLASIMMMVVGTVLFKSGFFYILAPALVVILLSVFYFKERMGGLTGDALGALGEVIEVITLLSICLLTR